MVFFGSVVHGSKFNNCQLVRIWGQPSKHDEIRTFPKLRLGNLEAFRDWGYAGDYVEAMWMMLQAEKPDDYVVATGESHTVREFLEAAFAAVDLDPDEFVSTDPRYMRPAEVDHLEGDPSKIKEKLGWEPKTSFQELVTMMVEEDLELAKREKTLQDAGFTVGARGTTTEYIPFQ